MTDTAEIHLRDEIGFWGVTDADFAKELAAVGRAPVQLYINSPGGSVFSGISIYNLLARHPAAVHVTVDGIAASIASVIAMAGRTVTMGRGSEMMIHNPSASTRGQAADMRSMADILDKVRGDFIGIYQDRAGGPEVLWRDRLDAETWFSAREAVSAGLADKVASAPATDRTTASATASARAGTAPWAADLSAEDVTMLGTWTAWSADYTVRESRRLRGRDRDKQPGPRPVTTTTLADGRRQRQVGRGLTVITGRAR